MNWWFYGLATALALGVVTWLVRAMSRATTAQAGVSSKGLNVAIYREQLQALEQDVARGAVSAAEAEAARDELQLRMLDDTQDETQAAAPDSPPWISPRVSALAMAVLVLTGSAGLYAWLGSPAAMAPVSAETAERDRVYAMVEQLAQKLQANPDNPQGWAMLARSYKVMGRLDDAVQAFAKTGSLLDTEPELMADYADLLAQRQGNSLDGKPMELVRKALTLNPKQPMALMLAAANAYQQGRYKEAITHWEALLGVLGPQSPDAEQLLSYIADARTKAGLPPGKTGAAPANAAQPDGAQILQMVERLAARLKDNPGDLEGWARLARSYKVLGRLEDAELAYSKAGALVDKTPDMLTDFADVLAQRAGGNLEGRPLKMIDKALALEPRHANALMLSGTAAYQRGDYKQAIAQWEKLQAVFEPGSPDAQWLAKSIAEAKSRLVGGAAK